VIAAVALLDRVRHCMRRDMRRFRPFLIEATRIGWVRDDFAARLRDYPDTFYVAADAVRLAAQLDSFAARTAAVDAVLRRLRAQGLFAGWRDEAYPVTTSFHAPPLMQIERASATAFGVLVHGVHVIGYRGEGDAMQLWIARRSRCKPVGPGKLDHLANGGQPIGLGLRDNLFKECWEEAGMPAAIAGRARSASAVAYLFEDGDGLRDEINFVFDLEVPADFTPRNVDGEVEEFFLWSADRVRRILAETDDFLYDAALGLIDFLVRRGVIGPETPDYLDLIHGLRSRPGAADVT
jgi:8-oxo-dGTP pyrophosphatase MutT (NUDIX family)